MFGQLVNYLLGTASAPADPDDDRRTVEPTNPASSAAAAAPAVVDLLEDDDGWLLVGRDADDDDDVDSEGNSVDLDDDADRRDDLPDALPSGGVDESWYITPPPCFTSTETVVMETSPLENLLIEHPSISVYRYHQVAAAHHHPHLRRLSQQLLLREREDADDGAGDAALDDDVDDAAADLEDRLQWPRALGRRRHVDVLRRQEVQWVRTKSAQRVQIQKACQTLKKGYLERSNKARDVNSRNQRQRRGEKSQGARRSHANNNRKC